MCKRLSIYFSFLIVTIFVIFSVSSLFAEMPNIITDHTPITTVNNGTTTTYTVDLVLMNIGGTNLTGLSVRNAISPLVPIENFVPVAVGDFTLDESKIARVDITIPNDMIEIFNQETDIFWDMSYTDSLGNPSGEIILETPFLVQ